MCWLAESFGFQRLTDAQVVLPNSEWFPDRFDGEEACVSRMFARICNWMGMDPERFELQFKYEDSDFHETKALGTYLNRGPRLKEIITVDMEQVDDPFQLVSTISHELAHALLIGDQKISPQVHDHEFVTDLTTVFLGLGIFSANSAFQEKSIQGLRGSWKNLATAGYMNEVMYGYSLGIFAWVRGEENPGWLGELSPLVQSIARKSIKYLKKTGDCLIRPDGFQPMGKEFENLSNDSIKGQIQTLSEDGLLVLIEVIEKRGLASPEILQALIEQVRSKRVDLATHLCPFLARHSEQAESVLPHLIQMAGENDPDLRALALKTLGYTQHSPEEVLPVLRRAMDSSERKVREAATASIGLWGQKAAPLVTKLCETLEHGFQDHYQAQINALAGIGQAAGSAVPTLLQVLAEGEGELRADAAFALGELGDRSPAVVQALRRALHDRDGDLVLQALVALGHLGSENPDWIKELKQLCQHEDEALRFQAAFAILSIPGNEPLALKGLFNLVSGCFRSEDKQVVDSYQVDCVYFLQSRLSKLNRFPIANLLERAAGNDPVWARFAVWVIGQLGSIAADDVQRLETLPSREDPLFELFLGLAIWRGNSNGELAMQRFIEALKQIPLDRALNPCFSFAPCSVDEFLTADLLWEQLYDRHQVIRLAILVACRQMGHELLEPLISKIQSAETAMQAELLNILAAVLLDLNDEEISNANHRMDGRLDFRNVLSKGIRIRDELEPERRRFELMTIQFGQSFPERNNGSETGPSKISAESCYFNSLLAPWLVETTARPNS